MSEGSRWCRLHHLPFALFVLTLIAVALGGAVRINDAGESCPDWPQCFGTWGFDISEEDQGIWYNDTGEYDSDGSAKRYTTGDIFLEWIHRFVTGILLGPLCILQWYLAFKRKEKMPSVHKASIAALVLVIVQGAMGMLTVRYDNIAWSVAAHLILAQALALALLWAWIRWMDAEGILPNWMKLQRKSAIQMRPRLYDLTLSTLVVLVLGAFVSSMEGQNGACSVGSLDAWPLCNGDLFAFAHNMHFVHRFAVVIVGGWLLWNLRGLERGTVRRMLHACIGLYILNLLLGGVYVLTATSGFIEILSLFHLLIASASFLCIGFAALLARNAALAPTLTEEE
ncbi:MAG: COX15/CtaA family protein [Candidatus Thalassarchaeaceae archaeon]|nr:COX15/CtaA family protein [Candidatus Thalassarchaeaceae archaeon]